MVWCCIQGTWRSTAQVRNVGSIVAVIQTNTRPCETISTPENISSAVRAYTHTFVQHDCSKQIRRTGWNADFHLYVQSVSFIHCLHSYRADELCVGGTRMRVCAILSHFRFWRARFMPITSHKPAQPHVGPVLLHNRDVCDSSRRCCLLAALARVLLGGMVFLSAGLVGRPSCEQQSDSQTTPTYTR